MSKVLLVNPPFYRLLGSHYNANSLGIAGIAAYLNQHGHDAWLYNADFLDRQHDFSYIVNNFVKCQQMTRDGFINGYEVKDYGDLR